MSYDIGLFIDTGGKYPACVEDVGSPTYNLAPMFNRALHAGGISGGMRGTAVDDGVRRYHRKSDGLDGMIAGEALPKLQLALQHMRDNRADYEKLNPPNGWGSYPDAIQTFEKLIKACEHHPKATVRV